MASTFDSFDRADNATSLGVGDSGQTYTVRAGVAGITSNQAYFSDTGGGVLGHAIYDSGISDGYFEITLDGQQSPGAPGIVFRETSLSDFWIWGSDGTNVVLRKRVADSYTTFFTRPGITAAGDVLKVRCDGPIIKCYYNGVLEAVQVTDSHNQTATNIGIRTSRTTNFFDNLSATELEATTTTPLYAASVRTSAASNPANAVGATDGIFTTNSGGSGWIGSWFLSEFTDNGTITGTQNLTLRVRQDSAGGASPTVDAVSIFVPTGAGAWTETPLGAGGVVSSATGQDLTFQFDASIFNPAINFTEIYVQITTTGSGGKPADRRDVQLDSIRWDADWVASFSGTVQEESDTLGISDSISTTLVSQKSFTDLLDLSDTLDRTTSSEVSFTDSESLGDVASPVLEVGENFQIGVSDTLGVSDTSSTTHSVVRSTQDAVYLNGSAGVFVANTNTKSDTVNLSESVSVIQDHLVDLSDEVALSETTVNEEIYTRGFSDASTMDDATELLVGNTVGQIDKLGLSDSSSRILSYVLDFSDDVALGSVRYTRYIHSTEDVVDLAEDLETASTAERSFTDTAVLSGDSEPVFSGGSILNLSDTLGLDEVPGTSHSAAREFSDRGVVSDTSDSVQGYVLDVSDSVSLTDSTVEASGYTVGFQEVIILTDTTDDRLGTFVVVADAVTLGDSSEHVHEAVRGLTGSAGVSDVVKPRAAYIRAAEDNVSLADVAGVDADTTHEETDRVSLSDSVEIQVRMEVSLSDSLTLSEDVETVAMYVRDAADQEATVDTLAKRVTKQSEDRVTLDDLLTAGYLLSVDFNDLVTLVDFRSHSISNPEGHIDPDIIVMDFEPKWEFGALTLSSYLDGPAKKWKFSSPETMQISLGDLEKKWSFILNQYTPEE